MKQKVLEEVKCVYVATRDRRGGKGVDPGRLNNQSRGKNAQVPGVCSKRNKQFNLTTCSQGCKTDTITKY